MFNIIESMHKLFLLALFSFFFLIIRKIFFKRKVFIILYYLFTFFISFVVSIAGGQVMNDALIRFEKYVMLEKDNKLNEFAQNSKATDLDPMLKIDLESFKNSKEFENYLNEINIAVDKGESITIGWILCLLTDIFLMLTELINNAFIKIKTKKNFAHK